ncbi:S-methyl-5'-thioinosine phosphorylase [Candidatus Bathyarchaeota archaeon]|nr:S-methyl-5'-thioinosine phosphorylase [Candidatus Bathyarchaeota archaeon]MBS7613669.1 S-methyl-5'-thioinosine phosphorylase [Candidatus Bathyarchaeota archaeon]MBS7617000.1 S-methyl-5'-thioinosine phosphorylase [Candidatus Bathyarchaeota archaeon]
MKHAIILGSGFETALQPLESIKVETPFNFKKVVVYRVVVGDVKTLAVLRHGVDHENPPHMVEYRANMWSLKELGANRLLAVNTVGAINPIMRPGDLTVPHNMIDFTKRRHYTFYNTQPVVHIDFTKPYCEELRSLLIKSTCKLGETVWDKSTYICTEGPRFETAAEIRVFRILGADVVGMTGCPEAALARELGLCYASLCIVSNMAAGMQSRITSKEVSDIALRKREVVIKVLGETIKSMPAERSCSCSIQTNSEFKIQHKA